MTSISGEWIYVVLNILKYTLTQTVSVFLCGVFGALVQTWQLAISPLLTATAKTSLSIVNQYIMSDSYSDYVVTIELLSGGVKFVHGLLMVSWYLSLQLSYMAFWLTQAVLTTSFATLNSLLYHETASVVNAIFICTRAAAAVFIVWLSLGLKILSDLVYQLLLILINLSQFIGSQNSISSTVWDFTLTISTVATDALYAIYQDTHTFIKIAYLTPGLLS